MSERHNIENPSAIDVIYLEAVSTFLIEGPSFNNVETYNEFIEVDCAVFILIEEVEQVPVERVICINKQSEP